MDLGMERFLSRKQNSLNMKEMITKLDYANIINFCFSKNITKRVQCH